MVELRDRYRGVLLGLACGDALGGPVEFKSRDEIAGIYPEGLREFVGGGWLKLYPGEITDDTQMTLAIARSLAETGSLDMDDIGLRFLEWYRSDPKDIGLTTRSALVALDQGVTWSDAGKRVSGFASGNAAGNGAVMRCAPVALRFRTDPVLLDSASRDSALITHADERCQNAALLVNRVLAGLLAGEKTSDAIERALATGESGTAGDALRKASSLQRDQVRSGGFVLDTMQAAIWSLVQHDSFEETVVTAVNLGADTDTTGAVAGALAGACYGVDAIPVRWRDQVQHRDELIALADRLLELSEA